MVNYFKTKILIISDTFKNIKSFFIQNKNKVAKFIFALIIFAVLIINSGYTYTYLLEDKFIQTIILLVSFLLIGTIYIVTKDFSEITAKIKKKKPSWSIIVLLIFALSAFLTIFVRQETSHLMMYASYGIRILSAFLIAKLINFKRFVFIYQYVVFILTCIAIFFFLFYLITGTNYSIFPPFVSEKGGTFYNYFFLTFHFDTPRMQGPFWEPGLLSSFLLLAMAFEVLFRKKIRIHFFLIYFIGMILTFSTFGYLCFVVILILIVNKKVESLWKAALLYFLIFGSIVAFIISSKTIIPLLAEAMPSVFGKMYKNGVVRIIDITRFNCPRLDFEDWISNPIFGNGMYGESMNYVAHLESGIVNSQTSTPTYFIAQFGILGFAFPIFFIVGLLRIKHLEIENKVFLLILLLLIQLKEPHQGIMLDWVLLFLFVKEGFDKDYKAVAFDEYSDKALITAINKKDDQSIIKKNIFASFAIKGISLILGFFSYPIYIKYFNSDPILGIWLTVLSLMSIIITLDLGLGNGLKNEYVKATVENNTEQKKKLITSTYVSTFLISLLLIFVLVPIIWIIDVNSIVGVNQSVISPVVLKTAMTLVCVSICLEFFLKNISSILQALQKQALSNIFALISTVSLIIFASIFRFDDQNTKLIAISIAYVFTINVPLVIGTMIVFKKKLSFYKFKWSDFNKKTFSLVARLGLGFFAIQLMILLLNATNETLISNFYGPSNTVIYTDYNKPFNMIISLFTIITLPYWAMVAKQKAQGNKKGITSLLKQLLIFVAIFAGIIAIFSIFFQPFLDVWLGSDSIVASVRTIIYFALFSFLWMVVATFSAVANGLSLIKPQIIIFAIAGAVKITMCILLGTVFRERSSWEYIVVSNCISYGIIAIGLPVITIHGIKKVKAEANNQI